MAFPIGEQIAIKVRSRLQLISVGSGFETTVAGTVVRPPRIWTGAAADYQITMAQGTIERNEELSYPSNPPVTAWNMPFTIVGELRPSEEATTPIEELCNVFGADAIRAICTPSSSWYNWDGLAINTVIGSIENFNSEEAAGFKLEFVVTFRTSENNPYELRV